MVRPSNEFDVVLDLCRDPHRRIVLATLAEEQRSLTLNDLTKTVLEDNHRTPVTEASDEELRRIQLSLYHVHIPKLASVGAIDYDPERHLVEPTEQFDQLQPYLSAIVDADPDIRRGVES